MLSEIRVTLWYQGGEICQPDGVMSIFLRFASSKRAGTSRQAFRTEAENAELSCVF
jgi:hypothetical protein